MTRSENPSEPPRYPTAPAASTGPPHSRWPHIEAAEQRSRDKMAELANLSKRVLTADEAAFIVFGSLARQEFTEGSDLDWAILIDARADAEHWRIVHDIGDSLRSMGFLPPGRTGLFGNLVFSHNLVHDIGGDDDTNTNMTRRLLMLLESSAIDVSQSTSVRARVLRVILGRYLQEDASFLSPAGTKNKAPRFLLNDIVRLWRTMAVDFATKNRDRNNQGWALRNIKLRMSRKLLAMSGILMCIAWPLEPAVTDPLVIKDRLIDHLEGWINRSPLHSLQAFVVQHAAGLEEEVLGPYDEFLALLGDGTKRNELSSLDPADAYSNATFIAARGLSERLDKAFIKLLFDSNPHVAALSKQYGVF